MAADSAPNGREGAGAEEQQAGPNSRSACRRTSTPKNGGLASAAPVINSPQFVNDSKRQHDTAAAQTWAGFLKETYRQKKNSGATVKLGSGFEIGFVGESFHVP